MQYVAKAFCSYLGYQSDNINITVDEQEDVDTSIKTKNLSDRIVYAGKILRTLETILSKTNFKIYKNSQIEAFAFERKDPTQRISETAVDYWDMLISNGPIVVDTIHVTGNTCATVFMNNDCYNFMITVNEYTMINIACKPITSQKRSE